MALEHTCNYIILGSFAHAQSTVVIGKLLLPSLLAIGATFIACIYSEIFPPMYPTPFSDYISPS